jgi:hypothetical protein
VVCECGVKQGEASLARSWSTDARYAAAVQRNGGCPSFALRFQGLASRSRSCPNLPPSHRRELPLVSPRFICFVRQRRSMSSASVVAKRGDAGGARPGLRNHTQFLDLGGNTDVHCPCPQPATYHWKPVQPPPPPYHDLSTSPQPAYVAMFAAFITAALAATLVAAAPIHIESHGLTERGYRLGAAPDGGYTLEAAKGGIPETGLQVTTRYIGLRTGGGAAVLFFAIVIGALIGIGCFCVGKRRVQAKNVPPTGRGAQGEPREAKNWVQVMGLDGAPAAPATAGLDSPPTAPGAQGTPVLVDR